MATSGTRGLSPAQRTNSSARDTAASAVGGASVSFTMLVAARACQGVFAALLAPSALSLLATTFTDPKERGKAFGVYGAVAASGSGLGLLIGGALTSYASWRWCM